MEAFANKFMCIDENLVIKGSYNSIRAQNFAIIFAKCTESETRECASEQEMQRFFRQKYILTLQNNSYLNLEEYGADKIVKSSSLVWNPINIQLKQESVHKIEVIEVEMQDSTIIDAGLWTEDEATLFRPVLDRFRPLNYNEAF